MGLLKGPETANRLEGCRTGLIFLSNVGQALPSNILILLLIYFQESQVHSDKGQPAAGPGMVFLGHCTPLRPEHSPSFFPCLCLFCLPGPNVTCPDATP